MDVLIYMANGLFLMSYAVRDMLHLRLLAVLASLCLVVYFATRPEPLVEAVFWNAFFAVLNLVLATRMLWRRRRSATTGDPFTEAAA